MIPDLFELLLLRERIVVIAGDGEESGLERIEQLGVLPGNVAELSAVGLQVEQSPFG